MTHDDINFQWVECIPKRQRDKWDEAWEMLKKPKVLQYQIYEGNGVFSKWITIPTVLVKYDEFPDGPT